MCLRILYNEIATPVLRQARNDTTPLTIPLPIGGEDEGEGFSDG
jgi:hypothetical protein